MVSPGSLAVPPGSGPARGPVAEVVDPAADDPRDPDDGRPTRAADTAETTSTADTTPAATVAALQAEVARLKAEVARLGEELRRSRRDQHETPPHYL